MNCNGLRAAKTGEASFSGSAPVNALWTPGSSVKVARTRERVLAERTSKDVPVAREAARVA